MNYCAVKAPISGSILKPLIAPGFFEINFHAITYLVIFLFLLQRHKCLSLIENKNKNEKKHSARFNLDFHYRELT